MNISAIKPVLLCLKTRKRTATDRILAPKRVTIYPIIILLFLINVISTSYANQNGPANQTRTADKNKSRQSTPTGNGVAQSKRQTSQLLQISKVFKELASQPLPKRLNKSQITEVQRYNHWLLETSRKSKELAGKWQSGLRIANTVQGMREMQESFNLQYLTLQNKMSNDNRQFSMISNIMKNKYDTAKNSIGNMR